MILKAVMRMIRKITLTIISYTVAEVIPSARHWGLCFMYVAWFYVCCLISSAKPLQITSTDALLILFLAVLGLHCCRISLVAERGGYSLVAVLRLLISVASLREHGLEEHGLSSCGRATGHVGSWNRNQTHVPCIGRWIINHWTIREAFISTLRKGKAKRKEKKRLAAFSVTCTRSWVRKGWSQIWRRWIWADFLQTKDTWTVPPANPEWHDWAVLAETSYLPHPSLWNFPEDTKAACSITHRKEGWVRSPANPLREGTQTLQGRFICLSCSWILTYHFLIHIYNPATQSQKEI